VAANLVVIYGAPRSGKSTLAQQIGRSMGSKTAIVSTDHLLGPAIPVADADPVAELDMVHVQLRLLVANYMKSGYNVIVEGPFYFERGGALHSYEADVEQLIALMRHLTSQAVVVRLQADAAVLAERARALGRESALATTLSIDAAYKERYGVRFYSFDSGLRSAQDIAAEVIAALGPADARP
jgi:predicted kinase